MNAKIDCSYCAGIVLYHPDLHTLCEQIKNLHNQVSHIYLIDNTPELDLSEKLAGCNKVSYTPNGANLGIAKALNQIMEKASCDGYSWVLTLDQDSSLPNDAVSYLYRIATSCPVNLGIVCPSFINRSSGSIVGTDGLIQECITSGSLTSVFAWKAVGGYNEWLFIDLVDFDFCARLNKADFKILQTSAVRLSHQLGSPKTKTIFGHKLSSPNYPPFRYYYQARNYLVFSHQHYKPFTNPSPLRLITSILLVEDDKYKKLKSVMDGIRDAKKYIKNCT